MADEMADFRDNVIRWKSESCASIPDDALRLLQVLSYGVLLYGMRFISTSVNTQLLPCIPSVPWAWLNCLGINKLSSSVVVGFFRVRRDDQ